MYEIQLEVAAGAWPALESLLEGLGALAVTQAGGDRPVFAEPGIDAEEQWSRFSVVALFGDTPDGGRVVAAVRDLLGDREITCRPLEDQAWTEIWKSGWQPQMFAGDLCVCPSWCAPPTSARHVIRLDPGQAFGTGTHPTTALCIDWLAARAPLNGQRIVDYGCGSGILALAAAKFGADQIDAVDIDTDALRVAAENVDANDGAGVITVSTPALLEAGRADILIANILLAPLLALEREFASLLAPGGRIALSGLLATQVTDVTGAYAADFEFAPAHIRGEWALLEGQARSA